jgi:hypothetical protein
MRAKLRGHATFANVVSLLALFVALGGTSYAAIKITGKNVTNGSLTGADIKKKSVPLNRLQGQLPAGAQGAKGDTGPPGLKGDAGTNGTNGTNASTHAVVRSHFSATSQADVNCNAGETVTGGGGFAADGYIGAYPAYSDEGGPATGWHAYGTGGLQGTYVYVLCASP